MATTRKPRRKSKPWHEKALEPHRPVWVVRGDAAWGECEVVQMPLRKALRREDTGRWDDGYPRIYFRKALANRAKDRRDAAIKARDDADNALTRAIESDD